MKNLALIREIYNEAFRELGPKLIKSYFKLFSLLFITSYLVVIYAFVFRLSTGYSFG